MRCLATALCCAILLLGPAAAEAGPAHRQAADEVVAAIAAKDDAALAKLAARDDPDPWRVADELCIRGEFDAALAFAKAAPRPDVIKLPAYVEARRTDPMPEERITRYGATAAAFRQGDGEKALAALGTDHAEGDYLIRISAMILRCYVLQNMKRWQEADELQVAAAQQADRVGWLSRAANLWKDVSRRAQLRFDFEALRQAANERIRLADRRKDPVGRAQALSSRAAAYASMTLLMDARRDLNDAIKLLTDTPHAAELATAMVRLGTVELKAGKFTPALEQLKKAQVVAERSKDARIYAVCLARLADAYEGLGEYGEAIAKSEDAIERFGKLNMFQQLPAPLSSLMRSHRERGDTPRALDAQQQLTEVCRLLGHKPWIANALVDAAILQNDLGEFERSLPLYAEALKITRRLGDTARQANALKGMAFVEMRLGDYVAALEHAEAARDLLQGVHNKTFLASANRELGMIHSEIGNQEAASAAFARADAIYEALGAKAHRGDNLRSWAASEFAHDLESAKALYERSLAVFKDLEHVVGVVAAEQGLATVALEQGDPAPAEKALRASIEREAKRGVELPSPSMMGLLAYAVAKQGRFQEAHDLAVEGEKSAVARGEQHMALWNRGWRANALAGLQRYAEALEVTDTALEDINKLALGLSDQGASALRSKLQSFYDFGMNAALGAKDVAAFARYMEAGRAGALLEALGGRERMRNITVPPALREAESKARARVRVAQHELDRVRKTGKRSAVRAARTELDDAQQALTEAVERIQRDAKSAAGLVSPKPVDLPTIQEQLKAGDALVMYRLTKDDTWALVVTATEARALHLCPTEKINTATELPDESETSDWTKSVAALRALAIQPLALSKDITRVLISPDGSLTDVPFSLLLPGRDVAFVSSGSTLALLRGSSAERGAKILALGDPVYSKAAARQERRERTRSWDLVPLPATRNEVEAIGDTKLLGKDASETKLLATLPAESRWRAVHLACHGLIDADQPSLSSLALTADDKNDGFLTCLDLFGLEINADLAVLSACETGQGRVYSAEGVYGLMRAFMLAGTPRVICSLWKVDDEATRALMLKFYELWHPKEGKGLSAATALRKAQEYVRAQPKWEHPYYWAAWVLHGLPD